MLMLCSATLGSSIFRGWYSVFFSRKIVLKEKSRRKRIGLRTNRGKHNIIKNRSIRYIIWINKYIIFPFSLFFFVKAIMIFVQSPDILSMGYRSSVFSDNLLFPPIPLLTVFRLLFIEPLQFVSLFLGCAIYFIYRHQKLMVLACINMIMQGIMMAGRFEFYIIVLVILTGIIYDNYFSLLSIFKSFEIYKFGIFIGVLVVLTIWISLQRGGTDTGLGEIANRYLIRYHTLGFTIFDLHLNDASSLLNQYDTFGRASLGHVERAIVFFLKRIDSSVVSIPHQVAIYLDERNLVGYDYLGKPIYANAFGTILYSIYLDGKVPLIIFASAVYGFCLPNLTLTSLLKSNPFTLAILFSLVYLGIFGIFQPLLLRSFWLILGYIKLLESIDRIKIAQI